MDYKFVTQQFLPISVEKAWDFFSSPLNLALITPPDMEFKVLSKNAHVPISEGMMIDYIVKPVARIPMRWKTEIGTVIPQREFTDKQLKGPYAKWEHRHQFEPQGNGVLMTDTIIYRLPLGWIGRVLHWITIRKRIDDIFYFRKKTLTNLFGNDHTD